MSVRQRPTCVVLCVWGCAGGCDVPGDAMRVAEPGRHGCERGVRAGRGSRHHEAPLIRRRRPSGRWREAQGASAPIPPVPTPSLSLGDGKKRRVPAPPFPLFSPLLSLKTMARNTECLRSCFPLFPVLSSLCRMLTGVLRAVVWVRPRDVHAEHKDRCMQQCSCEHHPWPSGANRPLRADVNVREAFASVYIVHISDITTRSVFQLMHTTLVGLHIMSFAVSA